MENNYNLETNNVTMTVSEIAQALRIGRNNAYKLAQLAYEDTENNYFDIKKIGQQYRAVTVSFYAWLTKKTTQE